jgi:hypothetical protein
MAERHTVLLRHRHPAGDHYDWMLDDPSAPPNTGKLVTFRVDELADQWITRRVVEATRLADHRRVYLEYEGALSDGRGAVTRVDEGICRPRLWRANRFVLDVRMSGLRGTVEAAQVDGQRWRVRVVAEAEGMGAAGASPRVWGCGPRAEG